MTIAVESKLKKKIFIIINDKSGSYRELSFLKKLAEAFKRDNSRPEIYYFREPKELAERVSRALEEGFRLFVVAGGDGTLALLANQIRDRGTIGILPVGTGNVIAHVLGIPVAIEEAVKIIFSSENIRAIDGLEINGRLFLMAASMGFTSSLLRDVDFKGKSHFGRLAYLIAAIRRIFRSNVESPVFNIQIDGESCQTRAAEVIVINTAPWGMPRYKIPHSRIDDGLLEVCVIHRGRFLDFFNALLDIVVRERKVALHYFGQGRQITIRCDKPLSVQVDGDIVTQTPVCINVVPRAVRLVVPAAR